jgi:membrane fusion protein (multidrug efflux system)
MQNKQPICIHSTTHSHRHWMHVLLLLILFIGYLFLAYWLLIGQFSVATRSAYVSGRLVSILPQNQGHVSEIFVKEYDLVVKGQPIATIDKANAYMALINAESNLTKSIQQVTEMYDTTEKIQLRAKTELTTAQKNLTNAQANYKKLLAAYAKQHASNKELQLAQITVEKATDALEEANLQINAAMSLPTNFNIYENPIVLESMDVLRTAYFNWLQSTVYAPDTGYIIKRQIQVGEKANLNSTLITLLPLNQIWVTTTINNADLKKIHPGQQVKLTASTYGNKIVFSGIVAGINENNQRQLPNQTRVRINIEPTQLAQHPLNLGVAMTTTIDTRNRTGKTLTEVKNIPELAETQDYRERIIQADQLINMIVKSNVDSRIIPGTQLGKL